MADQTDALIQRALEKLESLQQEARRLMLWVNQADELAGNPPRFDLGGADLHPSSAVGPKRATFKWSPGAFFNKPFAATVRMVLEKRSDLQGGQPSPASVDEIHEALVQGSFAFETSGAENQKNSIRISLGKNSTTFTRLPNSDLFGLAEWYGVRTRKPRRPGTSAEGADAATIRDAGDGDERSNPDAGEVAGSPINVEEMMK